MKFVLALILCLALTQGIQKNQKSHQDKQLNLAQLYESNGFSKFIQKFSSPQFQVFAETKTSDLIQSGGVQEALNIDIDSFDDPCLKESEFAYYIQFFTQWIEVLSDPAGIQNDYDNIYKMREAYRTLLGQAKDLRTSLAASLNEPRYVKGQSFLQVQTEPLIYSKVAQKALKSKTLNVLNKVSLIQTASKQYNTQDIISGTEDVIDALTLLLDALNALLQDQENYESYIEQLYERIKEVQKIRHSCEENFTPEDARDTYVLPEGTGVVTGNERAVVDGHISSIDIPEYVEESFPDVMRGLDEVLNDTIKDKCQSKNYYSFYINETVAWRDLLEQSYNYQEEIDLVTDLIQKTQMLIDQVEVAEQNTLFITFEKEVYENDQEKQVDNACYQNSTALITAQKVRYIDILAYIQALAFNRQDNLEQLYARYDTLTGDWEDCYGDQQAMVLTQTEKLTEQKVEKVEKKETKKKTTKKDNKLRKN